MNRLPLDLTMPKLELEMTNGTIRRWLVKDGADVRRGQPLVIVEADDCELAVAARADGVLRLTGVEGSTYRCGSTIGYYFCGPESVDEAGDLVDDQEWTPGLMLVPDDPNSEIVEMAEPSRARDVGKSGEGQVGQADRSKR